MPTTRRRRFHAGGHALLALTLALVLTGLALLAPSTIAQDAPSGITGVTDPTVRIVHASPDAPSVSVLVDGQPAAQNVQFGAATEYVPLAPGDHQVQVVPAEGGDPIIDQTVTLAGGTAYILSVTGPAAEVQLQTHEVPLNPIESGQALMRVIHAAPEVGNVDVAVAGTEEPLVGGVGYPDSSDYQTVAPGTYDFEVRGTDTGEVLTTVTGFNVEAGQAYDVVALGQPGTQTINLLPLATRVSAPCSEVFGVGQQSDTCLRIVHAVPDAEAVDIYLGESPVAQGLAYGSATEFVAAPSGEQQIRIVPAGGTADQALFDTTQNLERGLAYQITATGRAAEGIQAPISGVDLSLLPQNQARVRVVHASPDTDQVNVSVVSPAGTQTTFEGIEFGNQSGYVAFDAGSYGFQLRLTADNTLLVETPGVQLEPGMMYDIYAIGESDAGTLQLLVLAAQVGIQQGTVAGATPVATPMVTPATEATPVIAAGSTPAVETPGAATPAATPTS